MKRLHIITIILCIFPIVAKAQETTIRPEFTFKAKVGMWTYLHEVTGGVCFNNKWTVGGLIGGAYYIVDAAPGGISEITTAAYARRCFHFGGEEGHRGTVR